MDIITFKNKTLDFTGNNIYIMGILNVTPDSFSDGGKFNTVDKALFHAEQMIKQGTDIIDIGGESTKPFSEPVSESEELDRVMPVIEAVNKKLKTIISIDTYKSKIAEEALKQGTEIINDISGLTFDPRMKNIISEYDAACIIMHIKGTPKDMQIDPLYENVIEEIKSFLKAKTDELKSHNIKKIIIDPGFGFGKSLDDNYHILQNLDKFSDIKYPVLTGISRKSMIGKIIKSQPEERIYATVALNTIAALKGAKIIRVHDVAANYQAFQVIKKYFDS